MSTPLKHSPASFKNSIADILSDLPLGEIRAFDRIGSTNSEAIQWAVQGAPDLALVVANEQTAGRGRQNRSWFTPPDAALAFSLVLREGINSSTSINPSLPVSLLNMRWTALGALAVCQTLREKYQLQAQIKWPNDVLIGQRKTAGVLVEAQWQGDELQAVILGIGVNLTHDSVPTSETLMFPATCVEDAAGKPVPRFDLLRDIIQSIIKWRSLLNRPVFVHTWDSYMAFKDELVNIHSGDPKNPTIQSGLLIGLDELGRLKLKNSQGNEFRLTTGEISMHPAGDIPAVDYP